MLRGIMAIDISLGQKLNKMRAMVGFQVLDRLSRGVSPLDGEAFKLTTDDRALANHLRYETNERRDRYLEARTGLPLNVVHLSGASLFWLQSVIDRGRDGCLWRTASCLRECHLPSSAAAGFA